MSFFEQTKIQAADSGSLDAFGRWRVSGPTTLFDGKVGPGDGNLVFSNVTNNGTITYTTNNQASCAVMTVNAGVTGGCVRQSYKRFPYLPGKSQMVLITFVFGSANGSIVRQAGYYDDDNGVYLEQHGSTVSIVKRSKVTGTVVNTKIAQDDWNLDPLNGTGPSGITLNLAKAQILVIDLEWLGVGRVRVGFNIDGVTYYVHQFLHANSVESVYMSTATLPVRYYIENTGLGAESTLNAICSTVISEGGSEPIGRPYGMNAGAAIAGSTGNVYAALGLRMKTDSREAIYPESFSVIGASNNDYFAWYLWRNPTLAAGAWTAVANSGCEKMTGNASTTVNVSTGTVLLSGVALSQQNVQIPKLDAIQLEQGYGVTPVQIPLVLCVEPLTSMNFTAALNWREVT